jgi:hypothetical protein
VKPSQYEPLIWFSFIHNWHSALVRLASSEVGNFILSATQPMKCHAGKCAFDERPALRLARINIAPNPTAQTPMDVVLFFYTSPGPQCSPSIILQGSKCPDFVSCTYYLHLLRVEQHYQTSFFLDRTGPLFRCQQRTNHVLQRKIKFIFYVLRTQCHCSCGFGLD